MHGSGHRLLHLGGACWDDLSWISEIGTFFPGMIFPWQLQTLGCVTYQIVDRIPVLRRSLGGKWFWKIFRLLKKKKTETAQNGKINPEFLNRLACPQQPVLFPRGLRIEPFSFFPLWIEPRLEIRKSHACVPQTLGRGWGLLVSISPALICLTRAGPKKAPRHQRCQRRRNAFSGNNCFQYIETGPSPCVSRKCQWSWPTCRHRWFFCNGLNPVLF